MKTTHYFWKNHHRVVWFSRARMANLLTREPLWGVSPCLSFVLSRLTLGWHQHSPLGFVVHWMLHFIFNCDVTCHLVLVLSVQHNDFIYAYIAKWSPQVYLISKKIFFVVMKTFEIDSFSSFQMHNTVLFTMGIFKILFNFLSSPEDRLIDFWDRGREGEREEEKRWW